MEWCGRRDLQVDFLFLFFSYNNWFYLKKRALFHVDFKYMQKGAVDRRDLLIAESTYPNTYRCIDRQHLSISWMICQVEVKDHGLPRQAEFWQSWYCFEHLERIVFPFLALTPVPFHTSLFLFHLVCSPLSTLPYFLSILLYFLFPFPFLV